jgi:hypothetical protein
MVCCDADTFRFNAETLAGRQAMVGFVLVRMPLRPQAARCLFWDVRAWLCSAVRRRPACAALTSALALGRPGRRGGSADRADVPAAGGEPAGGPRGAHRAHPGGEPRAHQQGRDLGAVRRVHAARGARQLARGHAGARRARVGRGAVRGAVLLTRAPWPRELVRSYTAHAANAWYSDLPPGKSMTSSTCDRPRLQCMQCTQEPHNLDTGTAVPSDQLGPVRQPLIAPATIRNARRTPGDARRAHRRRAV